MWCTLLEGYQVIRGRELVKGQILTGKKILTFRFTVNEGKEEKQFFYRRILKILI
jgi:hypothetical protein